MSWDNTPPTAISLSAQLPDNTAPTAKSLSAQLPDNTAPEGVQQTRAVKVRFASTENIDLSSYDLGDDPIDGHSPLVGELLLLKDQTDPTENGIYMRGSLPIPRATGFTEADDLLGLVCIVAEGDTQAGKAFKLLATDIDLGTTELVWVETTNPIGWVDEAPTAITPS